MRLPTETSRWPSARRLLPSWSRPIAAVASSPRPAARFSSAAISPAPAPARSEPSASSPLPAAPSARPARSSPTAAAARRRPGPSFSSCSGPSAPSAVSLLPSVCSGAARRAIGAGADHGPHPGLGGDPPLPAAEQRRGLAVVVIGPRSVAATRTKGASQPGPTARSIVSALWRAWFEARQLVDPGSAGGEGEGRQGQQDQRHRDQAGGQGRAAQRRAGGGGDASSGLPRGRAGRSGRR